MKSLGNVVDDRQLSTPPKTRLCHICGRQYGQHSFDIHLKQCKELWVAREGLKEKKERKPLPMDPLPGDDTDIEEINRLANDIYNKVSLDTCLHCGRSFLLEKLIVHNRSCTAENPARRVRSDSTVIITEEETPGSEDKNIRPRWNATNTRYYSCTDVRGDPSKIPPRTTNISPEKRRIPKPTFSEKDITSYKQYLEMDISEKLRSTKLTSTREETKESLTSEESSIPEKVDDVLITVEKLRSTISEMKAAIDDLKRSACLTKKVKSRTHCINCFYRWMKNGHT